MEVNASNENQILSDVKEKLQALSKYWEEEGLSSRFPSNYIVWDTVKRDFNEETLVLAPSDGVDDIEAIRFYAEKLKSKGNGHLARVISEWLAEYTVFNCESPLRGNCPYTGSPVCCAHCDNREECSLKHNTKMCPFVEIGEVSCKDECEGI